MSSEIPRLHSEFERSPKPGVWKGPNVAIAQRYKHGLILYPGENNITVVLLPDNFPPFSIDPNELDISIRSRYAIGGLHKHDSVGPELYKARKGNNFQPFEFPFETTNLTERPMKLKTGARLFRPYYVNPSAVAVNGDLEKLIAEGKVEIEGEYGKDWKYVIDREGNQVALAVRILEEDRLWIPKHARNKPFTINDTLPIQTVRAHLRQLLKPLKRRNKPTHWTGKTVRISLRGIDARLSHRLLPETWETTYRLYDPNTMIDSIQTRSHLLDTDVTDWEVIIEGFGPTTKSQIGQFAVMEIIKLDQTV